LHRAPDERRWINLKPKNVCLARESNDLEALSKGLSTVNKMGLTAKYTAEVTAAKEVVAQLSAQDDARAAFVSALAANEVADIEAAIAAMEAAHVGPSEVRAAHKRASAENTTTARRARARATEQTKRARRACVLCGDDARRFLFRFPAGLAGFFPITPSPRHPAPLSAVDDVSLIFVCDVPSPDILLLRHRPPVFLRSTHRTQLAGLQGEGEAHVGAVRGRSLRQDRRGDRGGGRRGALAARARRGGARRYGLEDRPGQ
jgi:hypothetical protein